MSVPLVQSLTDPRILQAAAGLRPPLSDTDALPRDVIKFAPSAPTYRVTDAGTSVQLYGTTEQRHSICVNVTGFRPYLYISLEELFNTIAESERQSAVETLIAELDAQLVLMCAIQASKADRKKGGNRENAYLPTELRVFRDSLGASVRTTPAGVAQRRITLHEAHGRVRPVVDWELTAGLPVRGHGDNSGYRGLHARPMLRIYFFCPSLVTKARSILGGRFAKHGIFGQAKRLAKMSFGSSGGDDDDAPSGGGGGGHHGASLTNTKAVLQNKLSRAARERGQSTLDKSWAKAPAEGSGESEAAIAAAKDDIEAMDIADAAAEQLKREVEAALDAFDELYWEGNDVAADIDSDAEMSDAEGALEKEDEAEEDNNNEAEYGPDDEITSETIGVSLLKARERDYERKATRRFVHRVYESAKARDAPVMLTAERRFDVYEADIDFTLRFAVDVGFAYEQWLQIDVRERRRLPDGTVIGTQRVTDDDRLTRLQIELNTDYRLLTFDEKDPIQNRLPPHMQLCHDIEAEPGPHGEFPKPHQDRLLQCCIIIKGRDLTPYQVAERRGIKFDRKQKKAPKALRNKFEFRSVCFTLGDPDVQSAPREFCTERHVLAFPTETLMLQAIAVFVRAADPHMVLGYNSDGFDLPFMLERSKTLGCGEEFARAWGRTRFQSKMTVRERSFESSQAGKIVFTDVRAPGLIAYDVLKSLQRDTGVKERSLSLNSVAQMFVGEQKEDVSYTMIRGMQQTAAGRETLRSYCEKDALLPLEIMAARQQYTTVIETARINIVNIELLLTRGQQVRAKCALYKLGRDEQPLPCRFYTRTDAERIAVATATFQGAIVVDPRIGLHRYVLTLDQSSLYPSIIVTYNFCARTLVHKSYDLTTDPFIMGCADPVRELTLEERQRRAAAAVYVVHDIAPPAADGSFVEAPTAESSVFLRHKMVLGLGPKLALRYLAARKVAKKAMAAAEEAGDYEQAEILNGRQLQIKLSGNSLYGTFSAPSSFIYTPEVGDNVTRRGRVLIALMQWYARTYYAQHNVQNIYGDTDSIFVSVDNVKNLDEAAALGIRMAADITAEMKRRYATDSPEYNILELVFEKVFLLLLLIAKKRYAGLKYAMSNETKKLEASPGEGIPSMSGLESKRRDVTLLVSQYIGDVLALLLQPHKDTATALRDARGYVWEHMVRPLLDNSINPRMLVITKQLRMLPEQYAAKGQALPVHVHLAMKLIKRAGGPQAANAPRAGVRLPYVLVEGAAYEKVSERAEDPVYALENGLKIDSAYYLNKHVRPTLLRLFVPVLASTERQRTLATPDPLLAPLQRGAGASDAARKRSVENDAAEFVFGHRDSYHDPVDASQRAYYRNLVPATRRDDPPAAKRPRYETRNYSAAPKLDGKVMQHTLSAFGQHGARCAECGSFQPGQARGFVCGDCAVDIQQSGGAVASESACSMNQMLVDIEDLRCERSELAATCHECMGCADAPRTITCNNTDCKVLWDRKQNMRSLHECETRIDTAYQAARATGIVQGL